MKKTYSIKPTDIKRTWYLIDAGSDNSLGRVAAEAAKLLLGKGKPQYSNHIDCGDYVVITNASSLKVTGNKLDQKKYYSHSGHPGGLRTRTLREQMQRDPTRVIETAIKGMLPANKLLSERLKRLKVYSGSEHAHAPQSPVELKIGKGK
ncbi:MAG: 50S ribosomal protein L13 [Candidatus Saccharimonadales bacterium]